jgi:hypothetical protein
MLEYLNTNFLDYANIKNIWYPFYYRPDKAKDGKEPVYACVTVDRKRAYFALKLKIDPKSWDMTKGAAKGNRDEINNINKYLDEVGTILANCYKELQVNRKILTAKAVKDLYLGVEKHYTYTLNRLMAYHNETAGKSLSFATPKHYEVTHAILPRSLNSGLM